MPPEVITTEVSQAEANVSVKITVTVEPAEAQVIIGKIVISEIEFTKITVPPIEAETAG